MDDYATEVPPRKSLRARPADYLESGVWPDGALSADAPREARLAAAISARLRVAMGERTLRDVARQAELSPQTVANLVQGLSWGDMVTLARLEVVLGVQLWGREHRGR
jgi:hypothetical protein